MFKAIFWDNDGLLVDTEILYFKASKEALALVGIELKKDWYIQNQLQQGVSTFDLVREKGIPEPEVQELRQKRNKLYEELLLAEATIIDGVVDVLEQLKGNFQMGVVTSSRKEHFEIIMEKTLLRKYFDFFVTEQDVENTKPDPEPYLTALKISKQKSEDCLVLEDAMRGVQAAKAAGITCYAIPNDLTKDHDFSMADKVLRNLKELPNLLLGT